MPTPRLTKNLNPVARVYGRKLKTIREKRGLSIAKAAKQLGVKKIWYAQVEDGLYLPVRWLQDRILRWATEGTTFHAKSKRALSQIKSADSSYEIKFRMTQETWDRLRRKCANIGVNQQEFIILALERLLDEPNVLATFEEAAERLRRAYLTGMLVENPQAKTFLQADVDLCVKMGAHLNVEKPKVPISPALALVNDESFDISDEHGSEWKVEDL